MAREIRVQDPDTYEWYLPSQRRREEEEARALAEEREREALLEEAYYAEIFRERRLVIPVPISARFLSNRAAGGPARSIYRRLIDYLPKPEEYSSSGEFNPGLLRGFSRFGRFGLRDTLPNINNIPGLGGANNLDDDY